MLTLARVHWLAPMTYPRLSKAPIAEAVLNVRVEAAEWTDDLFASFVQQAASAFPAGQDIEQFEANVAMNAQGPEVSHTAGVVGRICWNEDKSQAVQARRDGFSVNHVRDYQSWEVLIGHAEEWWPIYAACALSGLRIVQCSVRYINKIPLVPSEDLSATLRTRPEVSAGLPQALENYVQSLIIPFPGNVRAAINQAVWPAPHEQTSRELILDIEASTTSAEIPASEVWTTFERLREVKNQCFFESLQQAKWEAFL